MYLWMLLLMVVVMGRCNLYMDFVMDPGWLYVNVQLLCRVCNMVGCVCHTGMSAIIVFTKLS